MNFPTLKLTLPLTILSLGTLLGSYMITIYKSHIPDSAYGLIGIGIVATFVGLVMVTNYINKNTKNKLVKFGSGLIVWCGVISYYIGFYNFPIGSCINACALNSVILMLSVPFAMMIMTCISIFKDKNEEISAIPNRQNVKESQE